MSPHYGDVIVVGSGLSALLTAKHLSKHMNVMVFTKSDKYENNSFLAQGGVASAIADTDTWQEHFHDTILAGCNHNQQDTVELLTKLGPGLLQELIDEGLNFDKDEQGRISLGMEGAHSHRRILHAGGDQTGRRIMQWLHSQVSHSVHVVEQETVVNILTRDDRCYGIKTINRFEERKTYYASHIIFATGGAGAMYSYTSNDPSVNGMALALAHQAGAILTDLEFMQFHPTMLHVNNLVVGLVSEAVRGEGAFLVNGHGKRIMQGIHPQEDLAPRDIVSRAIFHELEQGGKVFLNIENVMNFEERFPTISTMCRKHGISIEKKLLPVVPGAHFFMGGIKTDANGETSLKGLYAVGEAACNGVHGANRLASNSLLEAIVFSKLLAEHILMKPKENSLEPKEEKTSTHYECTKTLGPLPAKRELQAMMMKHAGIVRHADGLQELKRWVETYEPYWQELERLEMSLSSEEIERILMLQIGHLIASSALKREESRGAHFRSDFPELKKGWLQKRIDHQEKIKLLV
ncbi:L-aspartate oxidase [Bacillus tianshenii]|uniref:L-aspartate oxidase n=1 Tax=Sutcliffiella tianshenii TaxID=1463404 RepID=A0ABS2P1X6_9BACI|nr:L-aspartate oxidase [Bacillus tianshenii]